MCNLMKLKMSRDSLPFPPPLDKLWLNVKKIIDVFHFQNHVSAECCAKFSPVEMKQRHPDFNTQAREQTFVWVHRFRHILCSMNKVHHLFYLHRMVLRRNEYTCRCHTKGRKLIVPKSAFKNYLNYTTVVFTVILFINPDLINNNYYFWRAKQVIQVVV